MAADEILDELPLGVLLAMQEAMADPSELGRERARLRALDAGFHVETAPGFTVGESPGLPPRHDPEPIEMEAAPDGVESLTLRFDRAR